MDKPTLKLKNAPIVEAILDLECDMPPSQQMKSLETPARESFRPQYPKFAPIFKREHRIETKFEAKPQVSTQESLDGFRFLHEDEKQLVQVRAQGFSFNRLAPYSTLDNYLPEIERTWNIFLGFASPVQVRLIRLRYINRILLPMSGSKVELDEYFKVCPHLPDEESLGFLGFLNQHIAFEKNTGNQVNIILTAQPVENSRLPVIFDITAASTTPLEPGNWAEILRKIQSLRNLKNRVFSDTLTEKCINLFQI